MFEEIQIFSRAKYTVLLIRHNKDSKSILKYTLINYKLVANMSTLNKVLPNLLLFVYISLIYQNL